MGATVVCRTSVIGVDGVEDARVRADRHSPAARVDTLAHGGLSPALPAPSTGAGSCRRPFRPRFSKTGDTLLYASSAADSRYVVTLKGS